MFGTIPSCCLIDANVVARSPFAVSTSTGPILLILITSHAQLRGARQGTVHRTIQSGASGIRRRVNEFASRAARAGDNEVSLQRQIIDAAQRVFVVES